MENVASFFVYLRFIGMWKMQHVASHSYGLLDGAQRPADDDDDDDDDDDNDDDNNNDIDDGGGGASATDLASARARCAAAAIGATRCRACCWRQFAQQRRWRRHRSSCWYRNEQRRWPRGARGQCWAAVVIVDEDNNNGDVDESSHVWRRCRRRTRKCLQRSEIRCEQIAVEVRNRFHWRLRAKANRLYEMRIRHILRSSFGHWHALTESVW